MIAARGKPKMCISDNDTALTRLSSPAWRSWRAARMRNAVTPANLRRHHPRLVLLLDRHDLLLGEPALTRDVRPLVLGRTLHQIGGIPGGRVRASEE